MTYLFNIIIIKYPVLQVNRNVGRARKMEGFENIVIYNLDIRKFCS